MSIRYNVPGLGTITRDGAGAWIVEKLDGTTAPVPAEYRPILDDLDKWQRTAGALELTKSKMSPRVPALWDGPMPGDLPRSASHVLAVAATDYTDYVSFTAQGNVMIRALNYTISGILLDFSARTDDTIYLAVLRNGGEVFRLNAPTAMMMPLIPVHLILPPGDIAVRVVNTTVAPEVCSVILDAWERIPPVRR